MSLVSSRIANANLYTLFILSAAAGRAIRELFSVVAFSNEKFI